MEEIYAWVKHKLSYPEFQAKIQDWIARFGGLCDQRAAALLVAHEYIRVPCPITQVIPGYWFLVAGKLSYRARSSSGWFGILMDNSGGIGIWARELNFRLGESLQVLGLVIRSGIQLGIRAARLEPSILGIDPGYHRISQLKPGFYYELAAQILSAKPLGRSWMVQLRDPTGQIQVRIPKEKLGFQPHPGEWMLIRNGLMLKRGIWISPRTQISRLA